MTPTQDQLVKNIQTAVSASPELQKQLAAVKSAAEAAAVLTSAMGSPVTTADLKTISQAAQAQLTDEQLEAIAGGGRTRDDWIMISVASIGFGCAVGSIMMASSPDSGGCKELFVK